MNGADDTVVPLLDRARGEFVEMPGLRLTPGEAARLWAVDGTTSERILNRLVEAGFLGRSKDGAYLRASVA
jgi:DNA-binding MarR family transcriptional regulator